MANWRIGECARDYLAELLDSGFPDGSATAHFVRRLESLFAATFGSQLAISFTNGSITLHAALVAAGVKPDGKVIVPPLTMANTSLAVLRANAVPVLADVDPRTFNISPAGFAQKVTPRTKAIIPVGR